MIKNSIKIGETVKIDGLELIVKEWSSEMDCIDCRYYCTKQCGTIPCRRYERPDKKEVYFAYRELPDKPIGEEFCYGNATLVACQREENSPCCAKCYFKQLRCEHVPCMMWQRADRKTVYFKRVNK